MRQQERISVHAMLDHHDPTRASFVDGVNSVARALLLDEKSLRLRHSSDDPRELTIRLIGFEKVQVIDTSDIAFHLADRCPAEPSHRMRLQPRKPPSLPIVPTSHVLPSSIVVTIESTRVDREINERAVFLRFVGRFHPISNERRERDSECSPEHHAITHRGLDCRRNILGHHSYRHDRGLLLSSSSDEPLGNTRSVGQRKRRQCHSL